jgi:RNA polymerase sigma-70 factor (ECF subfamily)
LTNEEVHIEEIIRGCKSDNRKAQEQLYRSFYRVMMNLCIRYTKNEADALEVLNSGFFKVYKNINRFTPERGSIYTWIRTIIVNNCLDFVKSKQRFQTVDDIDSAQDLQLQPEVFSRINTNELLEHIRKLPPATQAVFNLFVFEGYSHKEIAEAVDISEGTSKWHLNDARKKLKQMITSTIE